MRPFLNLTCRNLCRGETSNGLGIRHARYFSIIRHVAVSFFFSPSFHSMSSYFRVASGVFLVIRRMMRYFFLPGMCISLSKCFHPNPSPYSEDGSVMLHDCRVDGTMTRAQGTLQLETEFTDVRFHPVMEHIFVTSDIQGRVCLRDTRMTFGPLDRRTKDGVVQQVSRGLLPSCFSPPVI
jgi:hypothetical protein